MQPNFRLYREAYDAATKANDEFAARFYLNLFPPPERVLIRAETIVTSLFGRLLLRDDVLAALQAQTGGRPGNPGRLLEAGRQRGPNPPMTATKPVGLWFSEPGQTGRDYQRGLRLARAACRLEPENFAFLNTLGVAQYRCGLLAEALATLTRSNDRNQEERTLRPGLPGPGPAPPGAVRSGPRYPEPAPRGDEGSATGRESGVAGLPPRGRDDRARPRLPGRPVRTLIALRITRTSRAGGSQHSRQSQSSHVLPAKHRVSWGQMEHAVGPIRSI